MWMYTDTWKVKKHHTNSRGLSPMPKLGLESNRWLIAQCSFYSATAAEQGGKRCQARAGPAQGSRQELVSNPLGWRVWPGKWRQILMLPGLWVKLQKQHWISLLLILKCLIMLSPCPSYVVELEISILFQYTVAPSLWGLKWWFLISWPQAPVTSNGSSAQGRQIASF